MNEVTMPKQEFDNGSVLIDAAKSQDAEAIMTLKRDAWLGAYVNEGRGISVEDIQKKFDEDSLATGIENWQRGIASEKEGGDRATFVARISGKVVGYTSPHTEGGQRRVGALYVSPDSQGKGIGSKLLKKALERHGPKQYIYVHVVSYNTNAIRFYESFGFQKTGVEIPEEFDKEQGIKLLPEIEMVLKSKI